jgi:hypothetical protein
MTSAVAFVHAKTLACQPRSTHDYTITFFAPFMTQTSLLVYFFKETYFRRHCKR